MKVRTQIYLFGTMLLGLLACVGPRKLDARPQSRPATTEYTIVGKLLGHDAMPMEIAHVHADEQTVAADSNGRFRIALAPKDFHRLRFTGVNHALDDVIIYHKGGELEVDVYLGTYPRAAGPVSFVTYKEAFGEKGPKVLTRVAAEIRPNGTFVAELRPENGRITYEVTGFAVGHSVNGTQAGSFVYDRDGDYVAVIETHHAVKVTFDPKKAAPAGKRARYVVAQAHGVTARLLAIQREIQHRQQTFAQAVAEKLERGKRHVAQPNLADKDDLAIRLAEATDPLTRAALLIAYFAVPGSSYRNHTPPSDRDRTLAREVLTVISPDWPWWSLAPQSLMNLGAALDMGQKETSYFDKLVRSQPGETISSEMLMNLLYQAQARGDQAAQRHFALVMATEYADSPMAFMARQFDPDRKLRSGQPLPAFELPALSSNAKKLSNQSIRGKTVLIMFWAAWCKPCWGQMVEFHEVFRKYEKRSDFSILSINVNDKRRGFDSFRKNEWAMPWSHAVLDAKQSEATTNLFGVFSLPTLILVGPDGTILATSFELQANLTAILENHLTGTPAVVQGHETDGE